VNGDINQNSQHGSIRGSFRRSNSHHQDQRGDGGGDSERETGLEAEAIRERSV